MNDWYSIKAPWGMHAIQLWASRFNTFSSISKWSNPNTHNIQAEVSTSVLGVSLTLEGSWTVISILQFVTKTHTLSLTRAVVWLASLVKNLHIQSYNLQSAVQRLRMQHATTRLMSTTFMSTSVFMPTLVSSISPSLPSESWMISRRFGATTSLTIALSLGPPLMCEHLMLFEMTL